jgi:isoleucyl-tRNA synthetase
MYTLAPTSKERRSAQTVLWQITETLVRLVAPILSFTSDEVWEYLPAVAGREASVHLALFPKPEEVFSEDPSNLLDEWKQLFAVRDEALQYLEEARQNKTIGKGLEADIEIAASGQLLDLLQSHCSDLKEILNVSRVKISESSETLIMLHVGYFSVQGMTGRGLVTVHPASDHQCARCWNFMPEVGDYGIWQNVCTRCQSALKEMGIAPPQPAEAAQ